MSNWYAKRLAGGVPQAPPPAHMPPPRPVQPPPQPAAHTQRPTPSSLQTTHCPSCGSGNYMKVGMAASAQGSFDVMRCYDCGYPKEQMGTGVGATSSSKGAVHKATQVEGGGFNPSVIIGRVE